MAAAGNRPQGQLRKAGIWNSAGMNTIARTRHLFLGKRSNARMGVGAKSHKDPLVIGAAVDLGQCLDLARIEYLDLLKKTYLLFKELYEASGKALEMPKNEEGFAGDSDLVKRNLDCAVINHLHRSREVRNCLLSIPFEVLSSKAFRCMKAARSCGEHTSRSVSVIANVSGDISGRFNPHCCAIDWRITSYFSHALSKAL